MDPTVKAWLHAPQAERDALFGSTAADDAPEGEYDGVLVPRVPILARAFAASIRALVWRGKVFARSGANAGAVVNKVTPLELRSVRGLTRLEASWFDGKPALVIDYAQTSFVARNVRDELRLARPGLYVAKVWWRRMYVADFALWRRTGG